MSTVNPRIVRSIYEDVGRGDLATALQSIDDEIEVQEADSLPYAGTYHGRAGFEHLIGKVFKAWKNLEFSILEVAGTGDVVFALLELRGLVEPRQEFLAMQVVEVWTLRDGKAVGLRPFYWDTAKLARGM